MTWILRRIVSSVVVVSREAPGFRSAVPCCVGAAAGCSCVAPCLCVVSGVRAARSANAVRALMRSMTRAELATAVESLRRVGGIYDLIAACVERDGAGMVSD